MCRSHEVDAWLPDIVEQEPELDLLVAGHAGVGSTPVSVRLNDIVAYSRLERCWTVNSPKRVPNVSHTRPTF